MPSWLWQGTSTGSSAPSGDASGAPCACLLNCTTRDRIALSILVTSASTTWRHATIALCARLVSTALLFLHSIILCQFGTRRKTKGWLEVEICQSNFLVYHLWLDFNYYVPFSSFFPLRTLIFALIATTQRATSTRWSSGVLAWMMITTARVGRPPRAHRRAGV